MFKTLLLHLRVDSYETMEAISEIVNDSECYIEEEESDYILVETIDINAFKKLNEAGLISDEELAEVDTVDNVKFYLD